MRNAETTHTLEFETRRDSNDAPENELSTWLTRELDALIRRHIDFVTPKSLLANDSRRS